MNAAEKLKALHEAASAYITHDEKGQEAVLAANHFVDVMVECTPQIVAVVEAAQRLRNDARGGLVDDLFNSKGDKLDAALAALDEALS